MSCGEIKRHIEAVCLGGEYGDYGKITKFKAETVNWFFSQDSQHTPGDKEYITRLFGEISQLTGLRFSEGNNAAPYILIHIGTVTEFEKYLNQPLQANNILGYANWNATNNNIVKSNVFVSKHLQGDKRNDVIREEITQALGNTGDTEYNNTIFYQYKAKTNEYFDKYFEIDKLLLSFLYHHDTKPGMVSSDIESLGCDEIMKRCRVSNWVNGENDKKKQTLQLICVVCIIMLILYCLF